MYQQGRRRGSGGKGLLWRVHHLFNALFERCASATSGCWTGRCGIAGGCSTAFMALSLASLGLVWLVGEDFFPNVDSGQMRLHARARRARASKRPRSRFAAIEREIRDVIPAGRDRHAHRQHRDSEQLDQHRAGRHSDHLQRRRRDPDFAEQGEARLHARLRSAAAQAPHERFPDMTFFFQPANITSQILNFGLPAPIDLQVVGRDADGQLQDRPAAGGKDRAHSRRGRRACPPGGRPAARSD